MRIGSLKLESNLFLSPLAGYTNLPFRLVVREIGGAGLCTTDLVNARSLLEKNPRAFKLIETRPADSPLAVQLFGSVPEEMRDAAIVLENLGVQSIDINMGCPVKKVCNVGGGSAMMTELGKTSALVKKMVDAVKIPVTAKMRLGWDDENLTAPDLARTLEDVGVAAIFVHGRTREQGFGGTVNLTGIRKVVEAVKNIPVIGNGDIITPQAAKKMFDETGCAGVSIGRGAFYDPWIFKRTLEYQKNSRSRREEALINSDAVVQKTNESPYVVSYENNIELPPEPDFSERTRIMCRHLDLMIEVFGEEPGCRMFRKVAPWYARRFGPCHEFNKRVVQISARAEFHDVLENYIRWRRQFLDEHGELLPRFQQPPMIASFMRESAAAPLRRDEPASTQREQIPVPKGPVEVW
ncbi:MAG TPA: tRNA-dihydrouridine synthase [Verrucomicrobiae bacterium]